MTFMETEVEELRKAAELYAEMKHTHAHTQR